MLGRTVRLTEEGGLLELRRRLAMTNLTMTDLYAILLGPMNGRVRQLKELTRDVLLRLFDKGYDL